MKFIRKRFSITKYLSLFFLILFLILFFLTFLISEILMQGEMRNTFLKYYLISFFGLFFWSLVIRLREEIQSNILTIFISLLVGLFTIEIILNFWQRPLEHKSASLLAIEYDERTKLEVIQDLISEGVDAVPVITPSDVLDLYEDFMPLGGISNKTTVGINETGVRMVYFSDRYGFNNPDSEWDSEEIQWLLTGDSFAEGVAVKPGEDIASQIRLITQNSVINLGRSGNGPLMDLAELSEYANKLQPKKVLWLYYEANDLKSDFIRDQKNNLLMRYLEDDFSQNLINRQDEIDSRLEAFVYKVIDQEKRLSLLQKTSWVRLNAIKTLFSSFKSVDYEINPKHSLFIKILKKAKNRVEGWGGKVYFVYLPMRQRYNDEFISHDEYLKKSEVIDLVKSLGIQVIDIHQEVFIKDKDPFDLFSLRIGRHYNANGYAKVAKEIVLGVKEIEQ
jgi:hypothetical protein